MYLYKPLVHQSNIQSLTRFDSNQHFLPMMRLWSGKCTQGGIVETSNKKCCNDQKSRDSCRVSTRGHASSWSRGYLCVQIIPSMCLYAMGTKLKTPRFEFLRFLLEFHFIYFLSQIDSQKGFKFHVVPVILATIIKPKILQKIYKAWIP